MMSICHQQEIFPLGEIQKLNENNFIFHPDTYGWHIDRLKFDLMLLNAAKKEGAFYLKSEIETIDNNFDEIWNLKLKKIKKQN